MPHPNEEELTERQLREELLSALNHDLRSPLGAIGIFCEILLLNPGSLDESQRNSLAMIQEANAKAQRILDDAMELASIYRGLATLRQLPTNYVEVLNDACARTCDSLRSKDINVSVDATQECCVVIDPEKIEQVVLRILEEAAAHCNRGDEICVSIRENDGFAQMQMELKHRAEPGGVLPKRPSTMSVKGRLGVRKPGESRYSLVACEKVAELMGGRFECQTGDQFAAKLGFPACSG
jgi:K+-sensing histidine kinase KdpD